MNEINNYLNELFRNHKKSKYTDKDGKSELFGFSVSYTSPKEKGEEICRELEDENRKQMENDFEKKCSKLKDKEQDICDLKNKIYYTNVLISTLLRNKDKCGKLHSICWDVINKRVSELRQDLSKYNENLKNLQKIK